MPNSITRRYRSAKVHAPIVYCRSDAETDNIFSGDDHTPIEGYAGAKPDNLTLFVFPSMAKLHQWYDSDAYKKLKADRLKASTVKFVTAMNGLKQ